MLRMMGWILGILGIVLTQQTAMAARTCSREEIREMIFAGSSMRQVEQECSNAREAFSRPLPNRPVQMPPPPAPGTDTAPPTATVEPPPEPASVAPEESPPEVIAAPGEVEDAPEEPAAQAPVAAPEPPASEAPATPDPLSDPDIVATATPATLATSDWRSRLPQVAEEPASVLTPIPTPEPATEQVSTTGQTPALDTDPAPAPESETPPPASSPVATATPSVVSPAPALPSATVAAPPPPATPEPTAPPSPPTVAETSPPEPPRMLSTATPEPAPTTQQRKFVPPDGEVPAADLTAVAVARPERAAPSGTALAVAANSCPQTSLWWSGGPSRSIEYIDICSIQLELGELDRYYQLIPFTGLNAATERRFDEDRNGISDKGTRVGNTVYWGGRDCADGVVRIRRDQCDATDKSGCAVVSLHLQAKPGQPPTTITLQPIFYLLYPNGSRLPSEGKAQSLGYQGCGG